MKFYAPHEEDPVYLAELGIEVWVPCAQDGNYFVSNLGGVASVGRVRMLTRLTNGYRSVYLRQAGKQYVHSLVMRSFGHSGKGRVHHLGEKTDDRLNMLEWRPCIDFNELKEYAKEE